MKTSFKLLYHFVTLPLFYDGSWSDCAALANNCGIAIPGFAPLVRHCNIFFFGQSFISCWIVKDSKCLGSAQLIQAALFPRL